MTDGFKGARSHGTAIYYLLAEGDRSAFHRIPADEIWHFYAGGPLEILLLHEDRGLERLHLGPDFERGQEPQRVVPGGVWFGARPLPGSGHTLCGCTVAPGFDFADFELGEREALIRRFPDQRPLIEELT